MVKILVIRKRTVDVDPDAGAADTTGQNVDRVRVAFQLWMTEIMPMIIAARQPTGPVGKLENRCCPSQPET
jgi:hypothetical protein